MGKFQPLYIGTAGWTVPKQHQHHFLGEGSHLERYARTLSAVEINSSFYKPHRPATYQRWSDSVPEHFRFSAKIPKVITHELQLQNTAEPLAAFVAEVSKLGAKLGPLLVQLPPSLQFESCTVREFFRMFREQFSGDIVCEPRHASWGEPIVEDVFAEFQISRVISDPQVVVVRSPSKRFPRLIYFRLHGRPRIYYSEYLEPYLRDLAEKIREHRKVNRSVWCIFDNTALGAAAANAVHLLKLLSC